MQVEVRTGCQAALTSYKWALTDWHALAAPDASAVQAQLTLTKCLTGDERA